VDDSIYYAENMHRHFKMETICHLSKRALYAINEVGNPTILGYTYSDCFLLPMALYLDWWGRIVANANERYRHILSFGLSLWDYVLI